MAIDPLTLTYLLAPPALNFLGGLLDNSDETNAALQRELAGLSASTTREGLRENARQFDETQPLKHGALGVTTGGYLSNLLNQRSAFDDRLSSSSGFMTALGLGNNENASGYLNRLAGYSKDVGKLQEPAQSLYANMMSQAINPAMSDLSRFDSIGQAQPGGTTAASVGSRTGTTDAGVPVTQNVNVAGATPEGSDVTSGNTFTSGGRTSDVSGRDVGDQPTVPGPINPVTGVPSGIGGFKEKPIPDGGKAIGSGWTKKSNGITLNPSGYYQDSDGNIRARSDGRIVDATYNG